MSYIGVKDNSIAKNCDFLALFLVLMVNGFWYQSRLVSAKYIQSVILRMESNITEFLGPVLTVLSFTVEGFSTAN